MPKKPGGCSTSKRSGVTMDTEEHSKRLLPRFVRHRLAKPSFQMQDRDWHRPPPGGPVTGSLPQPTSNPRSVAPTKRFCGGSRSCSSTASWIGRGANARSATAAWSTRLVPKGLNCSRESPARTITVDWGEKNRQLRHALPGARADDQPLPRRVAARPGLRQGHP